MYDKFMHVMRKWKKKKQTTIVAIMPWNIPQQAYLTEVVGAVVDVVGAVGAPEPGGAGARVGGLLVHAGRPVLTRVERPAAEVDLLLTVPACEIENMMQPTKAQIWFSQSRIS